jgi:hypothetical protein
LEKRDASLRYNKESATGPITHEYQQLKYSEALLKEEEQQSKYQGESLATLKAILAKIGNPEPSPESKEGKASKPLLDDEDKKHAAAAADDNSEARGANDYENRAKKTGVRTVEGDQLAREQALGQGKHYGREQTVESDRIAREQAIEHGKSYGRERTVEGDRLEGKTIASPHTEAAAGLKEAADDHKEAAQDLKDAAIALKRAARAAVRVLRPVLRPTPVRHLDRRPNNPKCPRLLLRPRNLINAASSKT